MAAPFATCRGCIRRLRRSRYNKIASPFLVVCKKRAARDLAMKPIMVVIFSVSVRPLLVSCNKRSQEFAQSRATPRRKKASLVKIVPLQSLNPRNTLEKTLTFDRNLARKHPSGKLFARQTRHKYRGVCTERITRDPRCCHRGSTFLTLSFRERSGWSADKGNVFPLGHWIRHLERKYARQRILITS